MVVRRHVVRLHRLPPVDVSRRGKHVLDLHRVRQCRHPARLWLRLAGFRHLSRHAHSTFARSARRSHMDRHMRDVRGIPPRLQFPSHFPVADRRRLRRAQRPLRLSDLPVRAAAVGALHLSHLHRAFLHLHGACGVVLHLPGRGRDKPVRRHLVLVDDARILRAGCVQHLHLRAAGARAIERRYRLAAEIDGLTGAATRRHFVERSTAILAAKPKHAALAVLDLDYFKKVNDTYGHLAGDAVLRAFGSHVGKRLEDGMLLGRMGGEEFALLMPDVDEERAEAFLESLRMSVEQATTHFNGNGLKVTTSIGMASIDVAGRLFDHLLAGADHALYVSKEQGRNKVSVFSQAMQLRTVLEKDGGETRVSLRTKRVSRVSVRTKMARDRA
ncbi:GGDEF domain-containing protein [Rhizobium sp. G21]|uniref:GGDEF domain-containing protein n=1 Tax=Rhizobium sp. G21 TaxID=2758439 RepID=UPI0028AAF37B|nr:GGDEF domain-containing protein [Rhizobium sp. G21]